MEPIQNRCKRDHDEQMDTRHSRYADDDNWDNIEPKKNRSNKLLGFNTTDVEQDRSKRKNSGDKDEKRKKSAGSGQAENLNEDDHEIKRESRSKISRKNTAERIEVRPNDVYDGKGLEGIQQSTGDYNDLNSLRKNNLSPGHESSEGNGTNKVYNSPEDEIELAHDWESEYLDRKENAREKGHVQCEHERKISSRRRWDDMGSGRKTDDGSYMDRSDSRSEKSFEQGNPIDKPSDSRFDSGHTRGCIVDSTGEKGVSCGRVGKREDVERSRGLSEALDDAQKEVTEMIRDDKSNVMARSPALTDDMDWHRCSGKTPIVKSEKHKQHDALHGSRDDVESMARSDEDVKHRMRDTNGRKVRYNKSPSSEESKSHPKDIEDHDRGQSESDTERNIAIKGKDSPKDSRDFRLSKIKDGGWVDKTMNLEGSKDHWGTQSKLATRVVNEFDNLKAWNSQIHEQVKVDGEKVQFLTGHKKDNKTRSEGGRFENSDSIEIKPDHNLDFASDVPFSAFLGGQADIESHQGGSGDTNDEEWGYPTDDDKVKVGYCDLQEKIDDVIDSQNDQIPGKNFLDSQGGNGRGQKGILNSSRICQGQNSGSIAQTSFGYSQGSNSFNKISQQGQKGGRAIRGGRGRIAGRDGPRGGIPVHMMGPPFGHLGLPSGTMQSMGPNMPPSVGPHLGPNVFIPPFAGPLAWPGGRGIDINMLVAPPNLPPIPPGPTGPRFASNLGAGLNQAMFFNQQVSGRVNANFSGSEFNAIGPVGREASNDKAPASWVQSRTNVPSGKAPSRGEQNDYSQNFVDTGMRPQNFIRELELTSIVEDYPKLRELIQRKDEIVINSSSPPMYYKTDLREFTLAPEFFGTKFDVILIDPPWEEYIHRAPGITDHMEYWTFEEIQNLKIEAIADTPSFIFLWVGDGVGLEQGRQCLKKWGFRRCEDICWVKTNKRNATPGLRHDSHTLFQHSKEHCLMGIKGTVRRSTDGHIIHANIDTDIIIAEEPPDGSTKKPDDMYRIVEHFSLGRRRLELFGGDHNIRPGWLTLGKGLTSSNFNTEAYIKNFTDKDGKVWHGGCGRNPPPDAPHLVATTPEIESLRPKSPPQKSQQQQQQQQQQLAASSVVVPLIMGGSSSTRRAAMGGSPSASSAPILYQHQDSAVSGLPIETAAVAAAYPWLLPPAPVAAAAAAALGGIRELLPDGNHMGGSTGDGGFDRNNASFFGQLAGDHVELDPHRAAAVNLMNINIM